MPKRNLDDSSKEGPPSSCVDNSHASDRRILRAAKKSATGSCCHGNAGETTATKDTVDSSNTKSDKTPADQVDTDTSGSLNSTPASRDPKRAKSENSTPKNISNGTDESNHVTSSSLDLYHAAPEPENTSSADSAECSRVSNSDDTNGVLVDKRLPKSILRKVSKYGPADLGVLNNSSSSLTGSTHGTEGVSGIVICERTVEKSSPVTAAVGSVVSTPENKTCATKSLCDPDSVRESVESVVESLSDKEIENDSVFDSSNDALMDTSLSPSQQLKQVSKVTGSEEDQRSPQRDINQGPTSSNAIEDSPPDLEPPRKRKKTVKFNDVKVYYFARKQGFICVPSQGGSTLGMADNHLKQENLTVSQHAKLQRELHKQILLEQHQQGKIHIPTPKLQQLQNSLPPSPQVQQPENSPIPQAQQPTTSISPQPSESPEQSSSEASTSSQYPAETSGPEASEGELQEASEGEDGEEEEARFSSEEEESEDELQVDEYYFLQPVPTRQRRAMLRLAGVKKIDAVEKDLCKDIRSSREVCGCDCTGVCVPATCLCSLAGIKCQVDRPSFPCGCSKDGCRNPEGRIEFNPIRVRTHFIHTLMRLENERKMEQRKRAIAAARHRRHLRFLEDGTSVTVQSPQATSSAATGNQEVGQDEEMGAAAGMDLSEFNSNEFGSCRDCQNSEVSHFLMRQRQQQQQQQQQARPQLNGANAYVAGQSDPPSCMGSGGVQQAYMATVEVDTTVATDQLPVGPGNPGVEGNPSGQIYAGSGGEEYLTDGTVATAADMFSFVQEEASYSESSEDCSSVGSNPETETATSAGILQGQAFMDGPQSFVAQSSKSLASQQYEHVNSQQQQPRGSVLSHQSPLLKPQSGGVSQLSNTSPPAAPMYHSNIPAAPPQQQPCTAAAEQKYMELNNSAASFKLEPISEILNPIRFPGYPSGSWHGNQSATAGSSPAGGVGHSISEGYTPYPPPLLHNMKPYSSGGPVQASGPSGDFNGGLSVQQNLAQIDHQMADGVYNQSQVSSSVDAAVSIAVAPQLPVTSQKAVCELTPLQDLAVSAGEVGMFQSSEQTTQNHVTSTTAAATKCYHELTKSTCHSASEAVYAASTEGPASTSTNLLTQESQQACAPLLSAVSAPVQPQPTETTATTANVLETLTSSATKTESECHHQSTLSSPNSVTTVTSSNTSTGASNKETVAAETAPALTVENTMEDKGEAENGSTTDDSEDSGLGSMAEEASSTQDFGEIIKTSIVETVSA